MHFAKSAEMKFHSYYAVDANVIWTQNVEHIKFWSGNEKSKCIRKKVMISIKKYAYDVDKPFH